MKQQRNDIRRILRAAAVAALAIMASTSSMTLAVLPMALAEPARTVVASAPDVGSALA